MALNWRKLFYPVAGDLFAPHTHIKALADSAITWVPVSNVTERSAVFASAGAVSAANPVGVIRADAGDGREYEYTVVNNTTWKTVMTRADTGWISMALLNGWVNFSVTYAAPAYRRLNGVTWITGVIKNGASSAGQAIANLPGGFRPAGTIMRGTVGEPGTAAWALEFDGATGNLQQGAAGANPAWMVLDMNFPADA